MSHTKAKANAFTKLHCQIFPCQNPYQEVYFISIKCAFVSMQSSAIFYYISNYIINLLHEVTKSIEWIEKLGSNIRITTLWLRKVGNLFDFSESVSSSVNLGNTP